MRGSRGSRRLHGVRPGQLPDPVLRQVGDLEDELRPLGLGEALGSSRWPVTSARLSGAPVDTTSAATRSPSSSSGSGHHADLRDGRDPGDGRLDLVDVDVAAAADDDLLLPAQDRDRAVGVEPDQVAGRQEAVGGELGRLRRGRRGRSRRTGWARAPGRRPPRPPAAAVPSSPTARTSVPGNGRPSQASLVSASSSGRVVVWPRHSDMPKTRISLVPRTCSARPRAPASIGPPPTVIAFRPDSLPGAVGRTESCSAIVGTSIVQRTSWVAIASSASSGRHDVDAHHRAAEHRRQVHPEAERRDRRQRDERPDGVARREPDRVDRRAAGVPQRLLGLHHALRPAGRARGHRDRDPAAPSGRRRWRAARR